MTVGTCRAALNRRKTELEAEAEQLVGMPFNLAAPGEVSNMLFVTLHLPPPPGAKRFKNGTFSTKVSDLTPLKIASVCSWW